MSSHHIIRDEQEPSLLVHSLKQHQWPIVLQLLEWSPILISCESFLDQISSLGHKVDIALVDSALVDAWKEQLQYQNPIEIRAKEGDQILPQVYDLLKKRKQRALNIITGDDQLIDVIQQSVRWINEFDVVIYSDSQRHAIVKSLVYKKWLPAYSDLALMPLMDDTRISTEGFDMNLDNERMGDGLMLSKKMEGEVIIRSSKSPILISETFG
ncbi:MAG: hypothetical protein JXR03_07005 [Cyclobacteriaceae bacterium]